MGPDPAQQSREIPASAEAKAAFLLRMRAKGIRDLDVLRALEIVPRELFVPHRYADLASRDLALPIACGQTLPEPFFVARMMEALKLKRDHRVLEIGTGSGYATAILAQLTREVMSIERFQTLAVEARTRLEQLAIGNAAVAWGDGLAVPPEAGLFDRIIVQCALTEVPQRLIEMLTEDGVLVMARGDAKAGQTLWRITRDAEGKLTEAAICPSRFQAILPGLARAL
jgi:protein-L-isoaspartate(D-aspartate) O-methyltransferase